MFLSSLKLVNFKNHTKATYVFNSRIVCFVGSNGVGKTNLLDAIYYLCLTKSYFQAVDQNNIKHGEDFFRLDAAINANNKLHNLKCLLQRGKRKEFSIDEIKYERLAEHVGRFPIVIITPDDNLLIGGGSEERRRFLDNLLSQIDRGYLENLQHYLKVLEQRNALLKRFVDMQYFDRELLSAYDSKLQEYGSYIFEKRKWAVAELEPIFCNIYNVISDEKETVKMAYESDLHEGNLDKLLQQDVEKDRLLKRTTRGIHKDDIVFEMDGFVAKRFGSQGQQKSFLLSLKLAQYQMIQKHSGIDPILLLDDVFDKLDGHRSSQLLDYLSTQPMGQVFITDTQLERLQTYFKGHKAQAEMIQIG